MGSTERWATPGVQARRGDAAVVAAAVLPRCSRPPPPGRPPPTRRTPSARRTPPPPPSAKPTAPTPTQRPRRRSAEAKAAKARAAADREGCRGEGRAGREDAHDAAALVAASKALARPRQTSSWRSPRCKVRRPSSTAAKAADQEAQTELDASVLAEQRATRDLAAVETRIGVSQQDLGRLARSAYQSSGADGRVGDRARPRRRPTSSPTGSSFLQSVGSAGNAMLCRLREDRADLVNAQAILTAARRRQEHAKVAAAAAVAAVQAKTAMAQAAAQQVTRAGAARAGRVRATPRRRR